jgi:hypothetical protein
MLRPLRCGFWRQFLARLAALHHEPEPTSRLAAHLSKCASCREAWRDFRFLATSISESLAVPGASADFIGRVWARVAAARRRPQTSAAVFGVSVLVAAMMFVGHARRHSDAESPAPLAASVGAEMDLFPGIDIPAHATSPDPEAARAPADFPLTRTAAGRTTPRRLQPAHYAVGGRAGLHGPAPVRIGPGAWAYWGVMSEHSGEYRVAAAAYGRAFQESDDPAAALAAGRASEEAGDVAGAVDYYARLLGGGSGRGSVPGPGRGAAPGSSPD